MSILRLCSAAYGPIDFRFIEVFDLEITNYGMEPFEMLVHGYGDGGLFHVSLIHAGAGQTVTVPGVMTHHSPFELVLVSNINELGQTGVVFRASDQGRLIAVYTQEDTVRTI